MRDRFLIDVLEIESYFGGTKRGLKLAAVCTTSADTWWLHVRYEKAMLSSTVAIVMSSPNLKFSAIKRFSQLRPDKLLFYTGMAAKPIGALLRYWDVQNAAESLAQKNRDSPHTPELTFRNIWSIII